MVYSNFLSPLQYTEAGEAVEDNPYVGLGNVSSLDLISFAYQIASGMVSYCSTSQCMKVRYIVNTCTFNEQYLYTFLQQTHTCVIVLIFTDTL